MFISTGNFECYGVTPKQSHQHDNNYFQLAEFFLTIFVYFHSPQKHLSSIFFCKNMLVFNKISARELCFFQCFPCFVLGVILTLIEQISEQTPSAIVEPNYLTKIYRFIIINPFYSTSSSCQLFAEARRCARLFSLSINFRLFRE